jgi:hypothetical protein
VTTNDAAAPPGRRASSQSRGNIAGITVVLSASWTSRPTLSSCSWITWARAYVSGPAWASDLDDVVHDCKIGPGGYVVTATGDNFAGIRRLSATGEHVFQDNHPTGSHTAALVIDPNDESIYATGAGTMGGMWSGKWSVVGDLLWSDKPGFEDGGSAFGKDLVLDADGWLRVVGFYKVDSFRSNTVIITYDSEGFERDRAVWTIPDSHTRAQAVATRGDTLFLVGSTTVQGPEIWIAAFKI